MYIMNKLSEDTKDIVIIILTILLIFLISSQWLHESNAGFKECPECQTCKNNNNNPIMPNRNKIYSN